MNNEPPNGFGFAVRTGLASFRGDAVAIVMADSSDSPEDLVPFTARCRKATTACSARGSCAARRVIDYPWLKLMMNRVANFFIRLLFWSGYNDTTNAFKLYRRQ